MQFFNHVLFAAFFLVGCSPTTSIDPVDRSDRDSNPRIRHVEKKPEERQGGWYPHPDFPGGHPPHRP